MNFNLTEKLYEIKEKGRDPLHMPGHKRTEKMQKFGNSLSIPYEFDITEIDGYDNLHAPEGLLLELGKNAASLYGAKHAYPLVNGSTAGIISSIGACTKRGDSVIISRASHKSVYSAIELFGLVPTYIYPDICSDFSVFASITPESIEAAFVESPNASVVVITSPTYEGVISNIEEIARVVHSHNARLIVDCAHGAHLGFVENEYFPSSSIKFADIAVVSLHKTLPALTQTALCLSFSNDADVLDSKIRRMLSVFMSSSPSYILLASIEDCLSIVAKNKQSLFSEYTEMLSAFEDKVSSLENLRVMGYGKNKVADEVFSFDKGKITVFCDGLVDFADNRINADVLAKFLRLNGFEPEMVSRDHLILMTSVMDDRDKILKVAELLCNFDMWCKKSESLNEGLKYPMSSIKMTPSEASECENEALPYGQCRGRISLDYIMCYPPGIPVIAPGEEITDEVVSFIDQCREANVNVIMGEEIKVTK